MPHSPHPPPIDLAGHRLSFDQPVLMGVLNVTPDSFSDGGRFDRVDAALGQAVRLVADGAQILDVGGESTRPGSEGVDADEERRRVEPVLEALAREGVEAVISIDTAKAAVARAALERGATLVNDVTALSDPAMGAVAAAAGAAVALMHIRGEPRTMQEGAIHYDDLLGEIRGHLRDAMDRAVAAGIPRERLLIDPGIGFGKTVTHNLILTRRLGELAELGAPILYGPSRKRFLGEITGRGVEDRERATAAACAAAVLAGAHVLRVHDVAAVRDAVAVAAAIRDAE